MKIKGSICGLMLGSLLATLLAFTPATANAQVGIGVAVGAPPVCPYGYYDYAPYACAPYGYWAPEFFYNGIFIGVGPWWGWGYGHGWGGYRFHGYYHYGGRAYGRPEWGTRGGYHGGFRGGRAAVAGGHRGYSGGHAAYGGGHGGAHAGGRGGGHGGGHGAGHADRVLPMQNYTKGLFLPIERKSVEPMAARLAPANVRQMHQSLHHIVAEAAWSDAAVLGEIRRQVLPAMTRKHPLGAWIVDDTGFPKKGTHSVGVTRQYCGQLGKQENCRIAVSVSLATEQASLPVAYQLYLPEIWAQDPARRKQAGVPREVRFQTKPEIALEQIRSLLEEDVPRAPVLADAAYGNDNGFRDGLHELGLEYAVGVQSSTSVWPPSVAPLPPKARSTTGRPPKLLRRDERHQPLSVKELALCLSSSDSAPGKLARGNAWHNAFPLCRFAGACRPSRLLAQ
jgi:hypothetical protein